MDIIQIIVLSLIQGLTEFLPVSSSAHLILVPVLTGWKDQGLAFDVAVHIGTLTAVMYYFRTDLYNMSTAWGKSVVQRKLTPNAKLAWAIILGTIPVGLVGLFLKDYIEIYLRSPLVIASTTIIFGLLLWLADFTGKQERDEHSMNWLDVLLIGLSQALALIPGTSRSGITMTTALAIGLTRKAAARFSFLLSIPVILLAGSYMTLKLIQSNITVDWFSLTLGMILSAISAYICIHYFLKLLNKLGMLPFVIYRLILGAVLFMLFWA